LASLRGLGRAACPQAAEEILGWVSEAGLLVPALPLQSALIQCCAERPEILIRYVQNATGPVREVLGRVLGEVATPSIGLELLQFVGDDLDELRAAAARALSRTPSGLAFDVLSELATDSVWYVRLRAIVSLGKRSERRAISVLLRGLTDSNRLVRLRAAEALVSFDGEMVPVFRQVVATNDRYALHAYLTAVENADVLIHLEEELHNSLSLAPEEKIHLQNALRTGALAAEQLSASRDFAKVPVGS
jgi:HEAT repeat protein